MCKWENCVSCFVLLTVVAVVVRAFATAQESFYTLWPISLSLGTNVGKKKIWIFHPIFILQTHTHTHSHTHTLSLSWLAYCLPLSLSLHSHIVYLSPSHTHTQSHTHFVSLFLCSSLFTSQFSPNCRDFQIRSCVTCYNPVVWFFFNFFRKRNLFKHFSSFSVLWWHMPCTTFSEKDKQSLFLRYIWNCVIQFIVINFLNLIIVSDESHTIVSLIVWFTIVVTDRNNTPKLVQCYSVPAQMQNKTFWQDSC